MAQFLTFIGFTLGWAMAGNVMLWLGIHPGAVTAVWLVGYVWGIAYLTMGSVLRADYALKIWLLTLGSAFGIAAIIVLAIG